MHQGENHQHTENARPEEAHILGASGVQFQQNFHRNVQNQEGNRDGQERFEHPRLLSRLRAFALLTKADDQTDQKHQ